MHCGKSLSLELAELTEIIRKNHATRNIAAKRKLNRNTET